MRPLLVASMDLDKIEERSQIGPRRRNDLPQGASGSGLPCRPGPSACGTSPPLRGDDKCGHSDLVVRGALDASTRSLVPLPAFSSSLSYYDGCVALAARPICCRACATISVPTRWCVQRGDLRRNARQRAATRRKQPLTLRRAGTKVRGKLPFPARRRPIAYAPVSALIVPPG